MSRGKPTFVDEHGVEYITLRLAETGDRPWACTGKDAQGRMVHWERGLV